MGSTAGARGRVWCAREGCRPPCAAPGPGPGRRCHAPATRGAGRRRWCGRGGGGGPAPSGRAPQAGQFRRAGHDLGEGMPPVRQLPAVVGDGEQRFVDDERHRLRAANPSSSAASVASPASSERDRARKSSASASVKTPSLITLSRARPSAASRRRVVSSTLPGVVRDGQGPWTSCGSCKQQSHGGHDDVPFAASDLLPTVPASGGPAHRLCGTYRLGVHDTAQAPLLHYPRPT